MIVVHQFFISLFQIFNLLLLLRNSCVIIVLHRHFPYCMLIWNIAVIAFGNVHLIILSINFGCFWILQLFLWLCTYNLYWLLLGLRRLTFGFNLKFPVTDYVLIGSQTAHNQSACLFYFVLGSKFIIIFANNLIWPL